MARARLPLLLQEAQRLHRAELDDPDEVDRDPLADELLQAVEQLDELLATGLREVLEVELRVFDRAARRELVVIVLTERDAFPLDDRALLLREIGAALIAVTASARLEAGMREDSEPIGLALG